MIERPIPFKAPMVRALLDGTKTQTRRAVKLPHMNPLGEWEAIPWGGPNGGRTSRGEILPAQIAIGHSRTGDILLCPYGQPSDRLWVRESWRAGALNDPDAPRNLHEGTTPIHYNADGSTHDGFGKARRSIQMPRWVSRITLEVTGVRVERLNDISEADALAEGIQRYTGSLRWVRYLDAITGEACHNTAAEAFKALWIGINGQESWDANPWVWAIKFKRIDKAGAP